MALMHDCGVDLGLDVTVLVEGELLQLCTAGKSNQGAARHSSAIASVDALGWEA